MATIKTKEKPPEPERERYYADDYDIVRSTLDVYSKKTGINQDMILFTSDETTSEFIKEQYKIARKLREVIKDKNVAEDVYDNLMSEIIMIALLRRNTQDNFIVKNLLKKGPDETAIKESKEEAEKQGLLERFLRKKKEEEE